MESAIVEMTARLLAQALVGEYPLGGPIIIREPDLLLGMRINQIIKFIRGCVAEEATRPSWADDLEQWLQESRNAIGRRDALVHRPVVAVYTKEVAGYRLMESRRGQKSIEEIDEAYAALLAELTGVNERFDSLRVRIANERYERSAQK